MKPISLGQYFILVNILYSSGYFLVYPTLKVGSRSLDHDLKVTGTSRSLEPNQLVLHLSVVRFHRLVHLVQCRQDPTACMPEVSSSKKQCFPLLFCLIDKISTYCPFSELLSSYEPIQRKITSRTRV